MDYFYTPPHLIERTLLVIEGDEYSHLTHVMRKNVGDPLCVVDGTGTAYDVVITALNKRIATCEIRAKHARWNEPATEITLAVGLLKNASRFDFLVEKTTELGVASIIPLLTERSIPRHARVDRWQKLALAAMKQSGRCIIPQVHPLTPLRDVLSAAHGSALRIILHETAELPLATWLSGRQDQLSTAVTICIGPEGGFSNEEIDLATRAGFIPVNLGSRRLRTETAAIISVGSVVL